MLSVKNCLPFFYFNVYQWQYNEAMQRGNAVCFMGCPKNRPSGLKGLFNFQLHEAEVLCLEKNIHTVVPNIFLTTLKMNKRQRVYTKKKFKQVFGKMFKHLFLKFSMLQCFHEIYTKL